MKNRTYHYDRFSLKLSMQAIIDCSMPGSADNYVDHWHKRINFKHIGDDDLKKELSEYGAWSDEELSDREANEKRILWVTAGNLNEEIEQEERLQEEQEEAKAYALKLKQAKYWNSEITLAMRKGEDPVTLPCYTFGDFAVHCSLGDETEYSVSHVPSGMLAVRCVPSFHKAKAFVRALPKNVPSSLLDALKSPDTRSKLTSDEMNPLSTYCQGIK